MLIGTGKDRLTRDMLKHFLKIGSDIMNALVGGKNRPICEYQKLVSFLLEWHNLQVYPFVIAIVLKKAMEEKGDIVIGVQNRKTKQVEQWHKLMGEDESEIQSGKEEVL